MLQSSPEFWKNTNYLTLSNDPSVCASRFVLYVVEKGRLRSEHSAYVKCGVGWLQVAGLFSFWHMNIGSEADFKKPFDDFERAFRPLKTRLVAANINSLLIAVSVIWRYFAELFLFQFEPFLLREPIAIFMTTLVSRAVIKLIVVNGFFLVK